MKTLKLKNIGTIDYKEQLTAIISNAPANGLSVDEVRKGVKALEVLAKAEKEVSFEDDIAEFVKKRVSESKFTMATKELVTFIDDVEKL